MAIPLVYKSALSVPSFQQSLNDLQDYEKRVKVQDEEKILWDMKQEQIKSDKVAAGMKEEDWVPEPREWELITIEPVLTTLKKFVVCCDSMGQDREFTAEEKDFALTAIYKFRKYWEEFEQTKLLEDRDALIKLKEGDAEKFTEEFTTEN